MLHIEVGLIIESSPNIECSSLNADLLFRGLSLFPMISSFRCENLYLNFLLDCVPFCEPPWASSKSSSSRCASEVVLDYELSEAPKTYETSEAYSNAYSGFEASSVI